MTRLAGRPKDAGRAPRRARGAALAASLSHFVRATSAGTPRSASQARSSRSSSRHVAAQVLEQDGGAQRARAREVALDELAPRRALGSSTTRAKP